MPEPALRPLPVPGPTRQGQSKADTQWDRACPQRGVCPRTLGPVHVPFWSPGQGFCRRELGSFSH